MNGRQARHFLLEKIEKVRRLLLRPPYLYKLIKFYNTTINYQLSLTTLAQYLTLRMKSIYNQRSIL